jgi:hypothetical protein
MWTLTRTHTHKTHMYVDPFVNETKNMEGTTLGGRLKISNLGLDCQILPPS